MPHRPDSEQSAIGHRGPAAPAEPPAPIVYPVHQPYRGPVSSYPPSSGSAVNSHNIWGGVYADTSYVSTPAPQSSKRGAPESSPDPQFKRVKTEPVKSVTPQDLSSQVVARHSPILSSSTNNKTNNQEASPVGEGSSVASEESSSPSWSQMRRGREPLKKRKKHLDVLRRNRCVLPTQEQQQQQRRTDDGTDHTTTLLLGQVSPVSTGSHQTTVINPEDNNHTVTTTAHHHHSPPAVQHTSSSVSYDIREAQALTESAKIGDTAEIGPRAVQAEAAAAAAATEAAAAQQHHPVVVAGFPHVLRAVLSSEVEGTTVLQWLPHGHAWRVVRWDALRRTVLPRYFPQLCGEEEQGSGGSIDAFLWNVRAWGFEEIKDGPDVGAYMHRARLFVRGFPDLSNQMECSVPSRSESYHLGVDPPKSPGTVRKNLLRVPSLATSRSEGSGENRRPDTPERYQHWRYHHHPPEEYAHPPPPPRNIPYHDTTAYGSSYGWHHYGGAAASTMQHHHRHEDHLHGQHAHYPHHQAQFSAFRTCPSPYDARYPFRPHSDVVNAPVSPPIRSGRGRLGGGGSKPYQQYHHQQQQYDAHERSSFPVSQRGKGSRARVCRTPLPTMHPTVHTNNNSPPLHHSVETTAPRHQSKKMLLLARSSASASK